VTATSSEDSGDDPLHVVLRERVEGLEARYAALVDLAEGDSVKAARLRKARFDLDVCRELLDEDARAD
jgi:hypothetical protein